jgi:hypothetical protein
LFLEYICVFEYTNTLHLFPQIYSNFPLYKMKWNSSFFNILLLGYILTYYAKTLWNFFKSLKWDKFQTCILLESNIMCSHLDFEYLVGQFTYIDGPLGGCKNILNYHIFVHLTKHLDFCVHWRESPLKVFKMMHFSVLFFNVWNKFFNHPLTLKHENPWPS